MKEKEYFKGSKNPVHFFKALAHDLRYYRENPDYFDPYGIIVFCGAQSSGKTLSAAKFVSKMVRDYPRAIVCTNLEIKGLPEQIQVVPFTDYSQIETIKNGIYGVIFLIDEIHVLWNSLESKNIPISEMACFAQMRKDRRIIIGTSQVYSRIAKPIREQLRFVVLCRNVLKYLQINRVIDPNSDGYTGEKDGTLEGEQIFTSVFFHSPADYERYNTLTKIERFERKKGV